LKSIVTYLKNYFSIDIKWNFFLAVILFLSVSIFISYYFNISDKWMKSYYNGHFIGAFIFYFIPFASVLLLYSLFYKDWKFWSNKNFIFLLLLTLSIYVFRCSFNYHKELVKELVENAQLRNYWMRVLIQLVNGLLLFIPVFIYWWFVDRKEKPLYGLKSEKVILKPYFIILLCLIPLILLAATQADFLKVYPRVNKLFAAHSDYDLTFSKVILFEGAYGFDFFMNEFFFRGFIILAFSKYLGKAVIMPMAAFYVFIHFGKPLGETISSFFGGLVLGILAYETRSVYGGVILHIGLAYLMEIIAYVANRL